MNSVEGKLVIISGPSGAGKSTVLKDLIATCPLPLELSVSVTTRPPRDGEKESVDYRFQSAARFLSLRDAGEFLEWKEVFGQGNYYGTLRSTVTAGINAGKWVVLEIDVEGAAMVLESYPEAITIFLDPGGEVELERRLRNRGTENEASIQRRLEVARREMAQAQRYNHRVTNATVEQAVRDICDILNDYQAPKTA